MYGNLSSVVSGCPVRGKSVEVGYISLRGAKRAEHNRHHRQGIESMAAGNRPPLNRETFK